MTRRRTATFAVLACLSIVATSCDWGLYRFGPNNTGYNPGESTIGVDNVDQLVVRWRGASGAARDNNPPVVADGYLYSQTSVRSIEAFDIDACESGAPAVCTPSFAFDVGVYVQRDHSVSNGVLFTSGPTLEAFDATGVQNCSGTPTVCTPLWTTTGAGFMGTPTVAGNRVYVAGGGFSGGRLLVFDANGIENCAGDPLVCAPLWSAPLGVGGAGVPTAAQGRVYMPHANQVSVFDAAGVQECVNRVCAPLWTVPAQPAEGHTVIAVTGDWAYGSGWAFPSGDCGAATCPHGWWIGMGPVATTQGVLVIGGGRVMDAEGIENCTAPQTGCSDLWRASVGATAHSDPIIANGLAYTWFTDQVAAYDLDGCGQFLCPPLWSLSVVGGDGDEFGAPVISDGWLYTVERGSDEVLAVSLP